VQIQTADTEATKLSTIPPHLGNLVSLAQAEIEELCTTHQFEYSPSTGSVVFSSLTHCEASVHLYPPPLLSSAAVQVSLGKGTQSGETTFAAAAMLQFEHKVDGSGRSSSVAERRKEQRVEEVGDRGQSGGGDGGSGDVLSVSEYVESLIEEATSVDNLSRMFEGWMPWI
jgi:hypothetical protein